MNRWVDIAIFIVVVALPVLMTVLLVTHRMELWLYLSIYGAILLGLEILKKLER